MPVTVPPPSRVVVTDVHVPPVQSVVVVDVPVVVPEPFAVVDEPDVPVVVPHATHTDVPFTTPGHFPNPQVSGGAGVVGVPPESTPVLPVLLGLVALPDTEGSQNPPFWYPVAYEYH